MPLNYRKNNLTLTSQYYNDTADLNGPGVCQDHRLNLMFENQKRYIGLVDSNHEQASDLTVNIDGKNLRLAKKSKYQAGISDSSVIFKGIGTDEYSIFPSFAEGKACYEGEYVNLINNKKVDKIYFSNQNFSLVNYKNENQENKTAYWHTGINTAYTDFPFSISKYINNSDSYHYAIGNDNKFYQWMISDGGGEDANGNPISGGSIYINSNFRNTGQKIDNYEQLTPSFANLSFCNLKAKGDNVLLLDVNNKLYGSGQNLNKTENNEIIEYGYDFNYQNGFPLISILPEMTFKTMMINLYEYFDAHFFAINSNNELYAWGKNTVSRLGLGENLSNSCIPIPTRVGENIKFKDACASAAYGIGIEENGQSIYIWGSQPSLPYSNSQMFYVPTLKTTIQNDKFSSIGVFNSNIFYLITENNKVYLWGSSEYQNYSAKNIDLDENDGANGLYETNGSSYAFKELTKAFVNYNVKKINFPYFLTTDNKLYKIRYYSHWSSTPENTLEGSLPPKLIKENVLDFYAFVNDLRIVDLQNNLTGSGSNENGQLLRKTWVYPFKNINFTNNYKKIIPFGDSFYGLSKDNIIFIGDKPVSYYADKQNLLNLKNTNAVEAQKFINIATISYFLGLFEFKNKIIKDFFILFNMFLAGSGESHSFPIGVILDENNKYYAFTPKNAMLYYNNSQDYDFIFENSFNEKLIKMEIFEDGKKIKKTESDTILTDTNEVYMFYDSFDKATYDVTLMFEKIRGLENNRFVDISGYGHILALSENKKLYGWGVNYSGQLGEGNCYLISSGSAKTIMPDCFFKNISAGYQNSSAIGEDGKLYNWGANDSWQLGFDPYSCTVTKDYGNGKIYEQPLFNSSDPVNVMSECKFVYSSIGKTSGMAIDCNGNLYGWGDGTFSDSQPKEKIAIKKLEQKIDLNKENKIMFIANTTLISEKTEISTQGTWV